MRRWLKRLLAAMIIAAATCAGWWIWYSTRDYGALFVKRRGSGSFNSISSTRGSARTMVTEMTIYGTGGAWANVLVRTPNRKGKFMGVLLAAGLETGARVIDLVEERDDVVIMAVDYGWKGEFNVRSLHSAWDSLRRLKTVSNDAVPRLLLALDYLARQPNVDTNRIVMVGVSYGSYFALPAAALEPRVSRVILVQGGGELGAVTAANAPRWQAPLPPRVAGWIGEAVLLPFQPERWIGRMAPRRVTFIASRTDPEFPVAAVELIYARAGEPKELVWHDTPHVAPDAAEIIAELSRVVLEQLAASMTTQ